MAYTLKKFATHLRKYLILDCCFAAEAYQSFQSAPGEVMVQQTLQNFDYAVKGTALLCASNRYEPAIALPGEKYTMFSTALLQILTEGVGEVTTAFTFHRLGNLLEWRIRERFGDEGVRPEVHSPDQCQGDIAQIPFFPNVGQSIKPKETEHQPSPNPSFWEGNRASPPAGASSDEGGTEGGRKPSAKDILPAPFAWIEIPGKNYALAKYPLTNAQYAPFIKAGGYKNKQWWTEAGWQTCQKEKWIEPRYWQDKDFNGADQPVVGVSWYEAVAYCLWLSEQTGQKIMLPTEEQWQYAAQGDDGREYPWGNEWG